MDRLNNAFLPDWYVDERNRRDHISTPPGLVRPFTAPTSQMLLRMPDPAMIADINDPRIEIQLLKESVARSERLQQEQARRMDQALNALQELTAKFNVNPVSSEIVADQLASDKPQSPPNQSELQTVSPASAQAGETPAWVVLFAKLERKYPKLKLCVVPEIRMIQYVHAGLEMRRSYHLRRLPRFAVSIPGARREMHGIADVGLMCNVISEEVFERSIKCAEIDEFQKFEPPYQYVRVRWYSTPRLPIIAETQIPIKFKVMSSDDSSYIANVNFKILGGNSAHINDIVIGGRMLEKLGTLVGDNASKLIMKPISIAAKRPLFIEIAEWRSVIDITDCSAVSSTKLPGEEGIERYLTLDRNSRRIIPRHEMEEYEVTEIRNKQKKDLLSYSLSYYNDREEMAEFYEIRKVDMTVSDVIQDAEKDIRYKASSE